MTDVLDNPADGLPKRQRIPLPPKNWRPRPPTASEKVDIIIRQQGRDALTGELLGSLAETDFHHEPAVHERRWDEEAQDTIPSATDVRFIIAIKRKAHKKITGEGNSRMSKARRLREREDDHQAALARKAAGLPKRRGSIQSRGFRKDVKRPMRSQRR